MHRPTLGIIAVVLLGAFVALSIWPSGWEGNDGLKAGCLRIGIITGAIWLAYPHLQRIPSWIGVALVVIAVAIAVRPKAVAQIALPVLLIYLALHPNTWARFRRK